MYISKHWSVTEWDCWRRSSNPYAWDNEHGKLCTNDARTEKLFKILDSLRDCDDGWVVNTTKYHTEYGTDFKSGYRTVEDGVNAACGGASGSWHTSGCAADIHNVNYDYSAEQIKEQILIAASWNGINPEELDIGCYSSGWCHVDTGGDNERWYFND